jgi:hypothetical protein
MIRLLSTLYGRRIINVNVNIIVAGLLAMLLTTVVVHLTHYVDIQDKRWIVAITFAADILFDVLIYYVLHWLANHSPRMPWFKKRAAHDPSFFKDATLVQFERALLGPVYYGMAVGIQYNLLYSEINREWATIIALTSGLLATRVLHTIWMLRVERLARRQALEKAAHAAGPHDIDEDAA